jgi:competence protein ComEC
MFSLVAASNLLRRSSEGYNIVAASAFLQLWINPYEITQVGFQLSYMAVLGIFAFYKPMNELIKSESRVVNWIWPVIAVSLAAQLTTSPLATHYFNMFPVYFLLTNLVVVPLSSLIIYFSIALLAAGAINLTFQWLALPLKWSLWLMIESVGEIQSWPGAVLESIVISPFQVILLYFIIVAGFGFFILRQRGWLAASMLAGFLILASDTMQRYRRISGDMIVVYSIPGHTAIDLFDGQNAISLADSLLIHDQQKMNFIVRPNRIHMGVNRVVGLHASKDTIMAESGIMMAHPFLAFKDIKIVLIDREWRYFNFPDTMYIDLAVISGNFKLDPARLASQLKIKQVVIDSSVPFYRAEEWAGRFEGLGVPCHSVRRDGAWVVRW